MPLPKRLPDGHNSWIAEVAPATADRSPVWGNYETAKSGPQAHLALRDSRAVGTLWDSFDRSVREHGPKPYLGWRPSATEGYSWLTYAEAGERAAAAGSALSGLCGLAKGDRVGVIGPNCPEWMLAMQACNRQGLACVPVYDTLGPSAVEYVLAHSGARCCFAAPSKLAAVLAAVAAGKTAVETVVAWGRPEERDAAVAAATAAAAPGGGGGAGLDGVRVLPFEELLAAGRASPRPADPPARDAVSTIMYTSGTTGDPKGVVLTHGSLVDEIYSLIHCSRQGADLVWEDDVLVSYLPLAHIFERLTEEMMTAEGCRIGFWRGDIAGLLDDMKELRPTLFPGVPRVFDRIYAKVQAGVSGSFVKRLLYSWLFARKKAFLQEGADPQRASPLADRILFGKIKALLGGRVRVVVSGGAPIASHTEDFARVAFCAKFVQGYGLTETCAATFLNGSAWDPFRQTVGFVLPGTEFCLESLPEMGYEANPPAAAAAAGARPRGEVLVRGPAVFREYYRDPARTAEAFSGEWFRTGDVGEVGPAGTLRIVDRAKNIFKLSQGEYVSAEHVEACLKKCPLVDQIFVHGESTETFLVAVVVPADSPAVRALAAADVPGATAAGEGRAAFGAVCASAALEAALVRELGAASRAAGLKGFETVRKVAVSATAFTPDNDQLTPSFKLRRPQLKRAYADAIKRMYGM